MKLHRPRNTITATMGVIALGLGVTASPAEALGSVAPADSGTASNCEMPQPVDIVIEVPNAASGTTDRVSVHYTPCTLDQPTPNAIVYLLHGASADETQWPDVNIFTAADEAVMDGTMPPSILVAPDAAFAYSCRDCADELLSHLLDEIEPMIERTAPVDTTRRAIGGISRGGGLALDVAGLAPNQFVAIGAHSSVRASDPALLAIAQAGLPVRFDVGEDDGLISASEDMAAFVQNTGGNAELVIGPGNHDRDYWRGQADAYIAFYGAHLD